MKVWLSVNEASELTGITGRAIQKNCKTGKYVSRIVIKKGRKEYRIWLDSLPDYAIERYWAKNMDRNENIITFDQGKIQSLPSLSMFQFKEKRLKDEKKEEAIEQAKARYNILALWNRYKIEKKGTEKFLEDYNFNILWPELKEILGEVSRRTLFRWQNRIGGTKDWKNLIITRKREIKLSEKEKKILLEFALRPQKLPLNVAIRYATEKMKYLGINPGHHAKYRRWLMQWREKNFNVWVLSREGEKALKDKVSPYILRDAKKLRVGQVLVADGHRLNFRVINPFTGKPCRATMVGYIDWRSFDMAGYEIMIEENTQCISSALRHSIIRLGKMPDYVYQDNGKAFRAKYFTNTSSFESKFCGLFDRLNIKPIWATPYNARAKIIENWWKPFNNQFERMLPAYTGSSIADKPAWMMRNEKFHRRLNPDWVPTIQEAAVLIDGWLEWRRQNTPCPYDNGKTIKDVFEEGRGPGIDHENLDELMLERRITKIYRNGIRFMGEYYWDDALYGLRTSVMIKYSLLNHDSIKVYGIFDGQYRMLCEARKVELIHPIARATGNPEEARKLEEQIQNQRRLEKKTKEELLKIFGINQQELKRGKLINLSKKKHEKSDPGRYSDLAKIQKTMPMFQFEYQKKKYEELLAEGLEQSQAIKLASN